MVNSDMCPGLLAYKIYQVDKANRELLDATGSGLIPIVRIIIESGALNATYLLIYTVTLETGTEALETVAEMSTVMFGVIATMLIVRVQINTERELRYATGRPLTTLKFGSRPMATVNLQSALATSPGRDLEKGLNTQFTAYTIGDSSTSGTEVASVEHIEPVVQKIEPKAL